LAQCCGRRCPWRQRPWAPARSGVEGRGRRQSGRCVAAQHLWGCARRRPAPARAMPDPVLRRARSGLAAASPLWLRGGSKGRRANIRGPPAVPFHHAPWFTRRPGGREGERGRQREKERWGRERMRGGRRWCWQMGPACHWEENEIYVFVYACSWAWLVFIRILWHFWGKLKIVMANFKIRE
jgi:hypothetical protein